MASELAIDRIEGIIAAIPVRNASPDAKQWYARHSAQFVVKIYSDGLVGIGEGFAYGAPEALLSVFRAILPAVLLGTDASDIASARERMARATRICGRAGIAACTISACEIALWDLLGKSLNKPVCELLGGHSGRRELPAYISLPRYSSATAAAKEAERLAAEGFQGIKLHQVDVQTPLEVRNAVRTEVQLMLDANCAWPESEAVEMAIRLYPARLSWLEEPVWPPEDYASIGRVKSAIDTRLSLGENEFAIAAFDRLLREGGTDIVQPSVAKIGPLAMMQVAEAARRHKIPFIPHSFYFGPGLAATAHVLAACDHAELIEMPLGDLPILSEPISVSNGQLRVPDGPGLGVALNEGALQRHEIARQEFVLGGL